MVVSKRSLKLHSNGTSHTPHLCEDLGHGSMDDNQEILHDEPPSLITTKRLVADADGYDLVMHIGDISYAEGFAGTVSDNESSFTTLHGLFFYSGSISSIN